MKKRRITSEWQSEWYGGKVVEVLGYEPDPRYYRDEYYINATDGKIYKRTKFNKTLYVWQQLSK